MPSQILFQIDTACVEYFSAANAKLAFVFSPLLGGNLSGNTEEGVRLLQNGFDVIVFKTNNYDWIQESPKALVQAVDNLVAKKHFSKKVAYGTAMGGYAAVALSFWLRPDVVMLVSPQYLADVHFTISQTSKFFVFFDNKCPDNQHLEQWLSLIPSENARVIRLPYSGQQSSQFLLEAGLLAQLESKVFDLNSCEGIDFAQAKGRSVAYLFNLGTALLGRNKLAAALGVTQKALDIIGSIWSLHFRKGLILARLGRYHDATHPMQAAIELEPNNTDLHYHLSICFLNLALLSEALQASSRVIALAPDRPSFLAYHSHLLWQNEKPDESLRAILLAIELDPSNADYRAHKSRMLQALGRLDDAIQAASKASSLAPDNQSLSDHLHALLEQKQSQSLPPLVALRNFDSFSSVELDKLLAPWR